MTFHDEQRAEETLRHISYYKIKEFAERFAKRTPVQNAPDKIDYNGIKFELIISRYYQDKNFRMYLLHVIEDIEVALKTQIAYVLGDTLGDYGYLNFSLWVDRSINKNFIIKTEKEIIGNLDFQIEKNQTKELKEKLKYGKNKNYPPIWLATQMLMFGDLVKTLKIMSRKNIVKISRYFKCSNQELISWMGTLNLVRNVSAHNSNLIDFELRTKPIIADNWKKTLHINKYGQYVNDKVSIITLIVIHFMKEINGKYYFSNIEKSLIKLAKDDCEAQYYGFKSKSAIYDIFPNKKGKKRKRKKRRKKKER